MKTSTRRIAGRRLAALAVIGAVLSVAVMTIPIAVKSVATRTDSGWTLAADRAAYTDVLAVVLLVGLLGIYLLVSMFGPRPARKRRGTPRRAGRATTEVERSRHRTTTNPRPAKPPVMAGRETARRPGDPPVPAGAPHNEEHRTT